MSPSANSPAQANTPTPPSHALDEPQLHSISNNNPSGTSEGLLFSHDHVFTSFGRDYRSIIDWSESVFEGSDHTKKEDSNDPYIVPPPINVRKNSIDAFLSLSPSHALGGDLFALKLSESENLPQLSTASRGSNDEDHLQKVNEQPQPTGLTRSTSPAIPGFVASFRDPMRQVNEGVWPMSQSFNSYSADMNFQRAPPHQATPGVPFHTSVHYSPNETSTFPVSGDTIPPNSHNQGCHLNGQPSDMMRNCVDPPSNIPMRNLSFLPPQDPTMVGNHLQGTPHQGGMFPGPAHPPLFPVRDQMHPQVNGLLGNMNFNQHGVTGNSSPGIFYMAVPVNGAQILQPVQMVQLPNGQQTFVVPTSLPPAPMLQPQMGLSAQSMNGQVAISHNTPQQANMQSSNVTPTNGQHDAQQGGNSNPGKKRDRRKKQSKNDSQKSRSNSDHYAENAPADAITALYGSSQRPYLSDLLGNVRRLSKDQVGCRLLQQSLDEDGAEAATAIFNESLPFLADTMTDPFGNYLFQKILEKINDGERLILVQTVATRLVNASLNLHGTRSVQKVVEVCANDCAASDCIAKALAPAAARLCIDSNGNHVVQRVLQKLSHQDSVFVFDAVATSVGDVARHRHGCCVIQRCLDSPSSIARSNLVAKIVENALDLMQDAYGNYVVQYVLDVCSEEEASAVCDSVVGKVCLLAVQKFSSNVMEKCLEKSNDQIQELYLQEISSPENIKSLMGDPFGNYVIQRGIAVATHSQAVRLVEAMRPHLAGMRNTAGGRRIVSKICRRFPKFSSEFSSDANLFLTCTANQENAFEDKRSSGSKNHCSSILNSVETES